MRWGVWPRIRAWDDEEVNRAKNDDKLTDGPGSDFGRMKVLLTL